MKKMTLIILSLGLNSSVLFAAGSHSGGHGHHNHDAHWASPKEASMQANPVKADEASIAKGSAIYQKNCASCHGKTAEGDGVLAANLTPKPTNLKQMSGGHTDGDFAWKIANGRGAMPAWKGILSDNDIWHSVNYIQSLQKTR